MTCVILLTLCESMHVAVLIEESSHCEEVSLMKCKLWTLSTEKVREDGENRVIGQMLQPSDSCNITSWKPFQRQMRMSIFY